MFSKTIVQTPKIAEEIQIAVVRAKINQLGRATFAKKETLLQMKIILQKLSLYRKFLS
ncbi:unnamed protein product [Oikopleura dioica]|uniref:Uncharacterized protein n=1 Tax=Oikopleura dioica TaxID=34765 RepID=E4Z3P6_OIKDI|nr:unnamed protein product [Oikopleura dioica]